MNQNDGERIRSVTDEDALLRDFYRTEIESIYEEIYEFDVTNHLACSPNTAALFASLGLPADASYDEALHAVARTQIKEEYRQEYFRTFEAAHIRKALANGKKSVSFEGMVTKDGGRTYNWMRITSHIYYLENTHSIHTVTCRKNIDDQKRLEVYVNIDPLTGLNNRYSFNTFSKRVEQSGGTASIGLMYADINGLKYVNDTKGHLEGDNLIRHMADLLGKHFRKDGCYRISGDEFVVIMDGVPEDVFMRRCEDFKEYIHDQDVPVASIGYVWEELVFSTDTMLVAAETEMYKDKDYNHKRHPEHIRCDTEGNDE